MAKSGPFFFSRGSAGLRDPQSSNTPGVRRRKNHLNHSPSECFFLNSGSFKKCFFSGIWSICSRAMMENSLEMGVAASDTFFQGLVFGLTAPNKRPFGMHLYTILFLVGPKNMDLNLLRPKPSLGRTPPQKNKSVWIAWIFDQFLFVLLDLRRWHKVVV